MNTNKYSEALVIFIDMLGTKDNDSFDRLLAINKLFRELTKEQEEQDNKEYNTHRIYKRTIFSFSDCAYIIYDYKENIDSNRKNSVKLSYVALYNTVYMLQKLIEKNYVFRGGVTFGDVYYDKKENIVFGPAIVEAYELESKCAKNPRVLIQKELAENVLKYHNEIKNKLKSKENIYQGISSINGEIIKQDLEDGKYYINYFNNIECDEDNFKRFILEQLEKARDKNNIKVMKKYLWLSKYYKNEILDKNDCRKIILTAMALEERDEFSQYSDIVKQYEENHIDINVILNKEEYDFIKNKDKDYINNLIDNEINKN